VSNWSGEDSIPKLQPETERSNDVLLDGATAPCAAIDAYSLRRRALSVEPSAPNQELPFAKRPERIERVSRRNHHTVARAQVLLSDLLKGSRMTGNGFQRLRNAGHGAILGRDWGQVNQEGRSPLGHRFGLLGALRTTRIAVVRKGSLRGYRKLLILRGREFQKILVRKVQVLDHCLPGRRRNKCCPPQFST
jgi:hypothetical protein